MANYFKSSRGYLHRNQNFERLRSRSQTGKRAFYQNHSRGRTQVNLVLVLVMIILSGTIILDLRVNDGKAMAGLFNKAKSVFNEKVLKVGSSRANEKQDVILSCEVDFTPFEGVELISYATSSDKAKGQLIVSKVFEDGTSQTISSIEASDITKIYAPGAKIKISDGSEREIVITEASYDQNLGALTKVKSALGYIYLENQIKKVWSSVVRFEAAWNTSWDEHTIVRFPLEERISQVSATKDTLQAENGDWYRLVEDNDITIVPKKNKDQIEYIISVASIQKHQKYDAANDKFVDIANRTLVKTFVWDEKWNSFIVGKAKTNTEKVVLSEYPSPGGQLWEIEKDTELVILENEKDCVEALVIKGPYMVKVMLKDGRVGFIREDFITNEKK